jgi:hypothetical protein
MRILQIEVCMCLQQIFYNLRTKKCLGTFLEALHLKSEILILGSIISMKAFFLWVCISLYFHWAGKAWSLNKNLFQSAAIIFSSFHLSYIYHNHQGFAWILNPLESRCFYHDHLNDDFQFFMHETKVIHCFFHYY